MKHIKRLFVLLSACVFVFSLVSFYKAYTRVGELSVKSPAAASGEGYVVRCEGDRLCIYPLDGGEPVRVPELRVSDLPEDDRQLLELGFVVESDEMLLALLEDYTG